MPNYPHKRSFNIAGLYSIIILSSIIQNNKGFGIGKEGFSYRFIPHTKTENKNEVLIVLNVRTINTITNCFVTRQLLIELPTAQLLNQGDKLQNSFITKLTDYTGFTRV